MSQRVCEWRGKFAREALGLVKSHFENEEFKLDNGQSDAEAIAGYVKHMLEHTDYGFRFVYQDTVEQVSRQLRVDLLSLNLSLTTLRFGQYFSFRHPFVSKLLGLHLQAISGSVGMESFGPEEDFRPLGALIVCCVAVCLIFSNIIYKN